MPSKNAVRESLSGCIIPVLPFRPATAGSPSGIAVLECVDHVVWLVLRGRSASAVVGTGCGPFLLPLQLLIAVRTLKADNSVCASSDSRLLAARQDAPFPGNFLLRPHAPIFDTRPAAAFPPIRSISNLRARAVCASPYGIDGPPRPSRALVAPMVFRRSDGASSRERCPHAASFSSRRGLRH
jgi:hypothetical protein